MLFLKDLGNIGNALAAPIVDTGKAIAGAVSDNPTALNNSFRNTNNNPVTNFVNNNLVKPIAQPFVGTANALIHAPAMIAADITNNPTAQANIQQKTFGTTNPGKIAEKIIGNTAGVGLTLGSGGLSDAVENLTGKALPSLADTIAPRVVSNAALGGGFGASSAASQGASGGQVVKAAAIGSALGGGIPLVRPGLSAVKTGISKLNNISAASADDAVDTAASDTPKTSVTLKQAGADAAKTAPAENAPPVPMPKSVVPEGQIPQAPIPKANSGIPEFDKAVNDIADRASKPTTFSGKLSSLINQAQGYSGQRLAQTLEKVMRKYLTLEEDEDLDALLDGEKMPHGGSPLVTKFYLALRPSYEQAHGIRSTIDPNVGQVVDYSPRQLKNPVTIAARQAGSNILDKLKAISDLRSGHSESRVVGKSVDSKGNVQFGSRKDLGLVKHNDGTITDTAGNHFSPLKTGKNEIEANTDYKYEHAQSSNAKQYFGETLSLKARAEAMQALKADPNKYGLYTQAQVDGGEAPAGVEPIGKVAELKDGDGNPLYAKSADAKELDDKFGFKKPSGLVGKSYDAVSNIATQFIVLNPFFHGMNQLYQTGIAAGNIPGHLTGWTGVAQGVANVNEDDIIKYLDAGGHIPTYGSDISGMISRASGGITKANSKAMMAIETKLRVGLYKASIDGGMKPADAIENIDRFLGDDRAIGTALRRTTLFAHYFRTMGKAIGSQVMHPIENGGAIGNTAGLAALTAAASYGYQKFTGNPNAHVRVPGELGLAQEAYDTAHGLATGQGLSSAGVITNHINPVAKEIAGQALNKDLYTGQPIGNTAKDKLSHVAENLIAPSQVASKVTGGKRSVAETVANQFGLETPHARGFQAAPNANGKLPFNTKAAIISKTGDPTDYQQQQSYFNNVDKLKSQFSGTDKQTTDALNSFLDRSHDPVTGQAIQLSPSESKNNAATLATNPTLLAAIQKFEKTQPSHDPEWDLSPQKLATLMTYKAQLEGSAERNNILANAQNGSDNWITDLQAKQQTFYNGLQKIPGGKVPIASGPTYPVFDPETTKLMATYNAASPAEKIVLEQQYGGELASAFNKIAQWTNEMRVAQTGKDTPQIRSYPVADAQTQAILNTYDALPKGGARSAWINANPAAYAKMQNYLTATSINSLITNAAKAQFAGTQPDQQLLKDIKNIGQYDIATTTGADGSTSYAVNPALAYTQSSSSGSSAASARVKTEDAARAAKNISKEQKFSVKKNNNKARKVKIKSPSSTTTPYKVRLPTIGQKAKVRSARLKAPRVVKSTSSTGSRKVALRV